MIIHSVTPAHMLMEQQPSSPLKVREIDGGYVEGYETPQGFCLSRVFSTDPAVYLKEEYSPGSFYKGGGDGSSK